MIDEQKETARAYALRLNITDARAYYITCLKREMDSAEGKWEEDGLYGEYEDHLGADVAVTDRARVHYLCCMAEEGEYQTRRKQSGGERWMAETPIPERTPHCTNCGAMLLPGAEPHGAYECEYLRACAQSVAV